MIDWIQQEFGLSLTDVAQVTGGADAAATVWRATARDGREYAVKLSGRNTDAAMLVARQLASAGIPGIVAPLVNRAGLPSSCREGVRLSVYHWIDGPRAVDTDMTTQHWRSFGALLGSVHRTTLPATLECRLRRETFDSPVVPAARARLAEFRESSPAFDGVSRRMVTAWLDAGASIAALVERSERLAAALRPRAVPVAVCHGDAHTINVIIGPGGQPFLLDWDEVSLAPPERDLIFVIGGGIFTDDPISDEQQRAFLAGYGGIDVDPIRLAYYYGVRALDDIVEFAKEILDRTAKPESREFGLRCVLGLLAPAGMVNVALSQHLPRS